MTSSAKNNLTWFKNCCNNTDLVDALMEIKLIICDVDGTLTDATVYTSADGEGGRYFSTQDGYITQPAIKAGIAIALVSGKSNGSTQQRGKMLGIPDELCIVGKGAEKMTVASALQQKFGITARQTLIFGDDFLDAQVKVNDVVSLYACPDNTPFYLQKSADIIIPVCGGAGAFRLLLDLMLFLHKKHFAQDLIEAALEEK